MVEHPGLYLVLVAAIGLGFMLGRRERARRRVRRISEIGTGTFQDINYLLDDTSGRGIEQFIDALPADAASIDTHLTLGAVVRRRGEFDQAIRIHRNLLARPHLSAENRALAELELARDYLNAGLLDRAEELLRELVERGGATDRVALEHLLDVYQRERDWRRAIEIATQIVRRGDREGRAALAHFLCELAQALYEQGDVAAARSHLEQARRHDRTCPRIGLQLAELELGAGYPIAARDALRDVVRVAPAFVGETIDTYQRVCAALAEPDGLTRFLEQCLATRSDSRVAATLARQYQRSGDTARAEQLLTSQLAVNPSLAALHALLAFEVSRGADGSVGHAKVMLDFAETMLARRSLYQCGDCGFAGRRLLWQCPGCRKWGRFAYVTDAV